MSEIRGRFDLCGAIAQNWIDISDLKSSCPMRKMTICSSYAKAGVGNVVDVVLEEQTLLGQRHLRESGKSRAQDKYVNI